MFPNGYFFVVQELFLKITLWVNFIKVYSMNVWPRRNVIWFENIYSQFTSYTTFTSWYLYISKRSTLTMPLLISILIHRWEDWYYKVMTGPIFHSRVMSWSTSYNSIFFAGFMLEFYNSFWHMDIWNQKTGTNHRRMRAHIWFHVGLKSKQIDRTFYTTEYW